MIAAWMLYAVVVSGLVAVAAVALDRLLRPHRTPLRWVWVVALLFGAVGPVVGPVGLPSKVAAVPWNPFLWWSFFRLRRAVEVDCDRRVLKHRPDELRDCATYTCHQSKKLDSSECHFPVSPLDTRRPPMERILGLSSSAYDPGNALPFGALDGAGEEDGTVVETTLGRVCEGLIRASPPAGPTPEVRSDSVNLLFQVILHIQYVKSFIYNYLQSMIYCRNVACITM